MNANLQAKQAIVDDVHAVAGAAQMVIAAEYRGLAVEEMTELRRRARQDGISVKVVKNTLARRALQDTDHACLGEHLAGPLLFVFVPGEPAEAARLVRDFARDHDFLVVKWVALESRLLQPDALTGIAELPTREQALAILMGTLLAPVSTLARLLNAPTTQLARTLAALAEQQGGA